MKFSKFALAVVLCAAGAAFAQAVIKTEVKSGLVIGKTDHSVILKMDDGVVKEFEVPPGKTAIIDGKETGLADLKVGTTVSATLTTVAKPVEVKTTTIRQGEVVKVNGSVLVYKENGKIFTKSVPKGFRFNVEGRGETGVEDLTPGMKLSATIVTTSTKMTTETKRSQASGAAPAAPAPAPVAAAPAPAPAPVAEAAPAPAKKKLPKTASPMPLVGLLGGLSVVAGAGLRKLRSR